MPLPPLIGAAADAPNVDPRLVSSVPPLINSSQGIEDMARRTEASKRRAASASLLLLQSNRGQQHANSLGPASSSGSGKNPPSPSPRDLFLQVETAAPSSTVNTPSFSSNNSSSSFFKLKGDEKEFSGILKVDPIVYHALKQGSAVVALESTIISHGMPFPQNLQTAKEVEAIVKQNGAIPATIAILDGVPCIGLNNEQLERLAKLGSHAQKTARRDIPHVIAARRNGATTVSATMFFASKVGIPVFVTGGIGGVHRHGEQTMDISSDLTELGRTPVAVVSAGVKSILDIPKTLEYLETQGVTVAAYRTNEFPSFFTESSGCQVPCRLDSPEECARLINANMNLRLGSGVLIAVPIPKEHAAYGYIIESAIQRALKEAKDKNVSGNAVTPFLLSRVNELTGGASLAANIALVKSNAYLGAKIAVALVDLKSKKNSPIRSAL